MRDNNTLSFSGIKQKLTSFLINNAMSCFRFDNKCVYENEIPHCMDIIIPAIIIKVCHTIIAHTHLVKDNPFHHSISKLQGIPTLKGSKFNNSTILQIVLPFMNYQLWVSLRYIANNILPTSLIFLSFSHML